MFANVKCLENKCETCKNLRLLVGDDGEGGSLLQANEIGAPASIKWERWTKSMNPVTGNPGWDFATVTTSFSEVAKDLMRRPTRLRLRRWVPGVGGSTSSACTTTWLSG